MSSRKARSRSSIRGRGRLPGGAEVATGYLTIENDGAEPDRLVSATAEIAGHTGIHQMSMANGVMKMRELTEGLPVPAGGSVALEPNSYHLMFTDLKEPLKEGDEFSGTLTFEKAGTVDVTFEVEGIGAGVRRLTSTTIRRAHGRRGHV